MSLKYPLENVDGLQLADIESKIQHGGKFIAFQFTIGLGLGYHPPYSSRTMLSGSITGRSTISVR